MIRRLEVKLHATWYQISEMPPCPPLKKGGLGGFWGIHAYANIPVWFR